MATLEKVSMLSDLTLMSSISDPRQQLLENKQGTPRGHPEKPESDDSKGENIPKCQNHPVTSENPETTVCASSGMQYHVSQSLGDALTSSFMAVILLIPGVWKCAIY